MESSLTSNYFLTKDIPSSISSESSFTYKTSSVKERENLYFNLKNLRSIAVPPSEKIFTLNLSSQEFISIYIDVTMPGIDGFERIEMKKNNGWIHHIEARHYLMFGSGLIFIVFGFMDFFRYLLDNNSVLFWINDIFLMFGGVVVAQVALRFSIRNSR